MMKGTFKIAFALLLVSLFVSQAESQGSRNEITVKYDKSFSFTGGKNGTLASRKLYSEDIMNQLLEYKLINVKVFAKNATTNATEIEEYAVDTSKVTWALSQSKDGKTVSLSYKTLLLQLSAKKGIFEAQLMNSFQIDAKKYPYTDLEFRYTFEYKSFLPYTYTMWDIENGQALTSNGIDSIIITADEKMVSFEKSTFTVKQKETDNKKFTVMHSQRHMPVTDGEVVKTIKLSNGLESEVEILEKGGRTTLKQNVHTNWPENVNFKALEFYNLNKNNEFEESSLTQIDFKKSIKAPYVNSNDKETNYTTHIWGSEKKNITQTVTVFSEDQIVYNFTNQERLADEKASYNLGEGENTINRGDIQLTYDFKGYTLPEARETEFGTSEFFEMPVNVIFDDKKFRDGAMKGVFYTYASLCTDNDKDGAKIVSVEVNNEKSNSNGYADNYITVRTKPFTGNAQIKLLFKFFDSNKRETLDEALVAGKEKLVFNNVGGKFLFTNTSWSTNNMETLEDNKFGSIRFNSLSESAKNEDIRTYLTKNLYFNLIKKVGKYQAASLFITENSNVEFTMQPAKKNGTIIEHKYLSEKSELKKENITLNEGEVYVNFFVNNWNPCIKNKDGNMPARCKGKVSDNLSAKIYIDEIIPGNDDEKPAKNDTKKMRFIQALPKNNTDDKEEGLKIECTTLKGNYVTSTENSIDDLPDFAENMINFNFAISAEMKILQGGFKVRYVKHEVTPTPSQNGGNAMLYIIIIVFAVVIIAFIVGFFIRRGKIRRASEEGRNRLKEDTN